MTVVPDKVVPDKDGGLGTEELEQGLRPAPALDFARIAIVAVALLLVFNSQALLDWTRAGRVRWAPLVAWALLLAGYAFAEFATHQRTGAAEPISDDPLVRVFTSFAIAARYLEMSVTSLGVSAFHEPTPSGAGDPLWIAGAIAVAAIAGCADQWSCSRNHVCSTFSTPST